MTDNAREEFKRLSESLGYSARMSDGVYVFAETQRAWRIFESQSARIAELEHLTDWAETLLCNVSCPPICSLEEWNAAVKSWRDRKHNQQENTK